MENADPPGAFFGRIGIFCGVSGAAGPSAEGQELFVGGGIAGSGVESAAYGDAGGVKDHLGVFHGDGSGRRRGGEGDGLQPGEASRISRTSAAVPASRGRDPSG